MVGGHGLVNTAVLAAFYGGDARMTRESRDGDDDETTDANLKKMFVCGRTKGEEHHQTASALLSHGESRGV